MAIGKDKTSINLTISKEDKAILQEIAKEQNRNLTNMINTILKEYIKRHAEQSK